jgi:hypothetical protein
MALTLVPSFVLGRGFGHSHTTVGSFLADLGPQIVVRSFTALATALLYFDLRGRLASAAAAAPEAPAATATGPGERAPGWYVDPASPKRMRYWAADGESGWSTHTAKTPKETLREWEERR